MTEIFNLVIKRWVLSATSHTDSTGGFKDFYGESFKKNHGTTVATLSNRAAAWEMRFYFQCAGAGASDPSSAGNARRECGNVVSVASEVAAPACICA